MTEPQVGERAMERLRAAMADLPAADGAPADAGSLASGAGDAASLAPAAPSTPATPSTPGDAGFDPADHADRFDAVHDALVAVLGDVDRH